MNTRDTIETQLNVLENFVLFSDMLFVILKAKFDFSVRKFDAICPEKSISPNAKKTKISST